MKNVMILFIAGIILISSGFTLNNSAKQIKKSSISNLVKEEPVKQKEFKNTKEVLIVKVLDGDTVETKDGEKIRYLGINTPENGQPKSKEAEELNKNLVLNKKVNLEFDVLSKDRYGRTLAYVFVSQSNSPSYQTAIFINQELVENGVAVVETIPPNVKYQKQILEAQKNARDNCLGIWQGLCKDNKTLGVKSENCIKIIFINADAVGDDSNNKNGEWIEIANQCLESINMENWLLKDSSASNKYVFKEFLLNSNQKVVLYSGCGEDSKERRYWQCPEGKYSIWNNSGDHAFLYNEKGELVSDYQY